LRIDIVILLIRLDGLGSASVPAGSWRKALNIGSFTVKCVPFSGAARQAGHTVRECRYARPSFAAAGAQRP